MDVISQLTNASMLSCSMLDAMMQYDSEPDKDLRKHVKNVCFISYCMHLMHMFVDTKQHLYSSAKPNRQRRGHPAY